MGLIIDREAIYTALFAQLQGAGTRVFKTYTRRWKSVWDDPAQRVADLPMMVQWETPENVIWTNRGQGPVRTIVLTLECYAKIPDGDTPGVPGTSPGSKVLNPLIDALEGQLLTSDDPYGGTYQTLGGLVTDCRIEGTITKVLGDEDPSGQCGALIPVSILVP